MNANRDACETLGEMGEIAVAALLCRRGHQVQLDGGNCPHDIVLNGNTTVEVKTALPSDRPQGWHRRWQFILHKKGDGAPVTEDLLVLRCQFDLNGGGAFHFVIPGRLLRPGLTKIDISHEPELYAGRYCLFLEAWELADALVALAGKDGRQLPPELPL